MQGSNVKGTEGVSGNETVATNPPQREAHPDPCGNQGKEKRNNELLHLLWSSSSERAGLSQQARLLDLLGGLRGMADQLGLNFQEAVTSSQGDGASLPFSAFDPCI